MKNTEKTPDNSPSLGTWLSSGSPVVVELAALCGLKWVLLDMEHGCLEESGLLPNLQALTGHGTRAIVRVPGPDAGLIARVLDRGADGIMVPHVSTAEEARALVRAMRYPPLGDRGYSRSVRAHAFGLRPPEEKKPLLFVQIESREAVEQVEAIAAVEGVDVLFVGPADLQLSLSLVSGGPSYAEALEKVCTAAAGQGKKAGILVRNRSETEQLIVKGFAWIAVDSDLSILREAFLKI